MSECAAFGGDECHLLALVADATAPNPEPLDADAKGPPGGGETTRHKTSAGVT
jgi:hypothetical protein